jgi:hypothetical protein
MLGKARFFIVILLLTAFMPISICFADSGIVSVNNLAPKIIVDEKAIKAFFGNSSEVNPLIPILKDIKGLRNLLQRALLEKDAQAEEILDSLANHPVPLVRAMFVAALAQSNPIMVFNSLLWQDTLAQDKDPVVKAQVSLTGDLLQKKLEIDDAVGHNFRNKIMAAGGLIKLIEKNAYSEMLADILDIKGDDLAKAVLNIKKDAFYNLKLEFDNNEITEVRRTEILNHLCRILKQEELKDISPKDLEIILNKANKQFQDNPDIQKLFLFKQLSREIYQETRDLENKFQGSSDELVYFIVARFDSKVEAMKRVLKELKASFQDNPKNAMYLEAIDKEIGYIYDLVNNLSKAVIIKDLKLEKKDIKVLLKSCQSEFLEQNKDRNIDVLLNLVPDYVEAVVSQDFFELLAEALKISYIFESKNKKAIVAVTLKQGIKNLELTLKFSGKDVFDQKMNSLVENILHPFTAVYSLSTYDAASGIYRIRNVLRACGGKISAEKGAKGELLLIISLPLHENYAFVNKTVSRLAEVLQDSLTKIKNIKNSPDWKTNIYSSQDKRIINGYKRNIDSLLELSSSYLKAEISLDELMRILNRKGANVLILYEELGSLSHGGEELQNNGMAESNLLMNLLIASYYSMEKINIQSALNNVINSYMDKAEVAAKPLFKVEYGSKISKLNNILVTYPNELRMLLNEFIAASLHSGPQNIDITVALNGHWLEIDISSPYDPEQDNFSYNLSLLDAIQKSTGALISINSDLQTRTKFFKFSLPVSADLKSLPLDSVNRDFIRDYGKQVVVLSGLRGANRNNVSHYLESNLGLKKLNAGFWMRVLTYYTAKENPAVYDKINALGIKISKWRQESEEKNKREIDRAESEIKNIIISQCVPYLQSLLGRIDFLAEPITIDGIDTTIAAEDGGLSIRDNIKLMYSAVRHRRFLYRFANNPEIQQVLDQYLWQQARAIIKSELYNGVTIVCTDPKQVPDDLKAVTHNFYLHAGADVRSIGLLQGHADNLMEWDSFTGKDIISFDEISKQATVLEVSENGLNMNVRAIGEEILDKIKDAKNSSIKPQKTKQYPAKVIESAI